MHFCFYNYFFLIFSDARRSIETCAVGIGGWFSTIAQSIGDVCGTTFGATLSTSQQDQHWSCSATFVSRELFQGNIQ